MKLKEGIPRHSQITQWLRAKIDGGDFKPDQKLPSENELAKQFSVSRVTIRRALQSLESDSIIYRCQGLGSFVNNKQAPHNLVRLTDFNEDMSNAGLKASSIVRQIQRIEAPEWLAELLHIESGQSVIQIDRLRLGDGEPVAFDSTWLPLFYGQLIEPDKLTGTTIYKILEMQYDIPILRGCYRISAVAATRELAHELEVDHCAPLLLIDRTTWTIGEKPVYYQKRYYRSDRVLYEMTLEREQGTDSGVLPLKEFLPIFPERSAIQSAD